MGKKSFNEMSTMERRRMYQKRRRLHALQKRITTLIITTSIVLTGVIGFNVFNAKAKSYQNDETLYKYYKNVEIQCNDTLWDLAKANYCKDKQSMEEYMNEVKRINHLEDDAIVAGNYLVLPYYSNTFVSN